jgi:hypothetical protein
MYYMFAWQCQLPDASWYTIAAGGESLVSGDRKAMKQAEPIAKEHAHAHGRPLRFATYRIDHITEV